MPGQIRIRKPCHPVKFLPPVVKGKYLFELKPGAQILNAGRYFDCFS
jgi:Na+-transporting NADH:ubiquinone oxidoreductase subunit NqrF